jgi:hypothetical protein
VIGGLYKMDSEFLRQMAARCIAACRESKEPGARDSFLKVADELLTKANELDVVPPQHAARHRWH